MDQKPYAVLLGGKHPGAILELHDIRFVLAKDRKDLFKKVAKAWFGDLKSAHVDAYLDLSEVDGHVYSSSTDSSSNPNTLYFVNVGSYRAGVFNEEHDYFFLIGKSIAEVKVRAKKLVKKRKLLHVDNAEKIEMIIPIKKLGTQKLRWLKSSSASNAVPETGYWPLKP